MNIKILIILLSIILIVVLSFVYSYINDEHNRNRFVDAKVLKEIPVGFVLLSPESIPSYEGRGDWENGMRHVSWESVISFYIPDIDNGGRYHISNKL